MVTCAMLRASGLLVVLMLAACAHGTTILLSDFDTSCVQDQDCAVVFVGEICGCDCGNAAIDVAGLAAYHDELAEKGMYCTAKVFCSCQGTPSAVCKAGQCAFVAP